MGIARLAAAIVLVAALCAGAVAVATWSRGADAPSSGAASAGPFGVRIVGPANASLYEGAVTVANATALSALRAACDEAGLALEVESYPGMGAYVRAIGPHRAHGASGWIYEVTRGGAGGEVRSGDRSAASFALHKGDALAWRWVDA